MVRPGTIAWPRNHGSKGRMSYQLHVLLCGCLQDQVPLPPTPPPLPPEGMRCFIPVAAQGAYFIDRAPKHFERVLNFM